MEINDWIALLTLFINFFSTKIWQDLKKMMKNVFTNLKEYMKNIKDQIKLHCKKYKKL
jgi:hypothetical protein